MKKIMLAIVFAVVIFFVVISGIRARMNVIPVDERFFDVTVILDAGHGGKDGGASSDSGVIERDLVLLITREVESHLRLAGIEVILTRDEDNDLASPGAKRRKREDLNNRLEIINGVENAIAISIHANSTTNRRWSGAQTFYDPKSLENKQLAAAIMNSMRGNIEGLTREQKAISNIYILRHSNVPTTLVEVGFLSNSTEADLLADEDYQALIAYTIFEGILAYLENPDSEG